MDCEHCKKTFISQDRLEQHNVECGLRRELAAAQEEISRLKAELPEVSYRSPKIYKGTEYYLSNKNCIVGESKYSKHKN